MSAQTGKTLLELARKAIAERLGVSYEPSPDLERKLTDEIFDTRRGTFVTLKIDNQLRGCIGNLTPDHTIREGVAENSVNAAFKDPRFPPLTRDEFDAVQLEISLLTEPVLLDYKDPADLLAKLTPGEDGVIIRKGVHSSTFLPQVWEQLPDKAAFLGNLCMKAGLPADEWKKGDLQVYTYRVRYFEDNA